MKCMTKYVAFDVHQATTVASVRGAVHVTFEVGTQSQWLYELVSPLVDRVVVCDPRRVTRQGNNGDRVDADRLSELLRLGGLRVVYAQSAHRSDLRELTRTYRTLVDDGTRAWLAQLTDRGVRVRAESLYKASVLAPGSASSAA
ncbi:hypothetical protein ACFL3B_02010 [Gemmatimonadota bacterium]